MAAQLAHIRDLVNLFTCIKHEMVERLSEQLVFGEKINLYKVEQLKANVELRAELLFNAC